MIIFILKRLLSAAIIVLGVLSLTFLMMHLAPGDPSLLYIRPEIPPDTVELLRTQMGLNQPFIVQYRMWIREFILGNFGISFIHLRPVREVLWEAGLNTLQLTLVVFIVQLVFGTGLGVLTALKKDSKIDHIVNPVLLFLHSVPGFWLGLMLILIFSYKLGWLPSGQMNSIDVGSEWWMRLADRARHLALPVIVLSLPLITQTTRFVRTGMIEVLNSDYIRTARAYGLPAPKIIFHYALKNALMPVITLLGLYFPFLLGGAVVIESIFAWPGMGRLTVEAIYAYDFPLILGSCFVAATAVVIGNLVSDILYHVVDPRIRLQHRE